MSECSARSQLLERKVLSKDDNGVDRAEAWNYRSVIGMMLYLSTNSRSDIAFTVN